MDQTSSKSFHGNKSHVLSGTGFYQLKFLYRGKIAERELHGFVQTGSDTFFCDTDLVRSDTDVADHTLFFCFQHTFIHSCSIFRAVTLVDTVELIQIQIVCPE